MGIFYFYNVAFIYLVAKFAMCTVKVITLNQKTVTNMFISYLPLLYFSEHLIFMRKILGGFNRMKIFFQL